MPGFGDVSSWIGRILDERYEVVAFVGDGATAVVFEGRHIELGRPVAIKLLHGTMSTPEQREIDEQRFVREARALGRVSHPNVCGALDFGIVDGMRYLVLEFVTGASLFQLLEREGRLPTERVAGIGLQIADGLTAVHSCGLVHRDLKPENIVLVPVSENGEPELVKILDFGLAKLLDETPSAERLTMDGSVCGTPHYMAPEQAVDDNVGPSADLYALGVVLFELTAGRLPFDYDSLYLLMQAHVQEPPPDVREFAPDAPEWLAQVIQWLMQKEPHHRPASAADVRDIIAASMTSHDGPARLSNRQVRALAKRRLARGKRRGGNRVGLVAALVVVALVLAGVLVWQLTKDDGSGAPTGDAAVAVTGGAEERPQTRERPARDGKSLVERLSTFADRPDVHDAITRRADNPQYAVTALRQLLVSEPDNPYALYYLALSQATLEQPIDALGNLDRALTLEPELRNDRALLDTVFGYLDQPLSKDVRPAAEKLIVAHGLQEKGRTYLEAMASDPTRPEAAHVARRLLSTVPAP